MDTLSNSNAAVVIFHIGSARIPDTMFYLHRRLFVLRRTAAGWKITHFHGSAYPVK